MLYRWRRKANKIFRYFFPKRTLRSKLPLSPRAWSSNTQPWGAYPKSWVSVIVMLKWYGLANTESDGVRLLKKYKYPAVSFDTIVQKETRSRRFWPRMVWAWRRFKRMW